MWGRSTAEPLTLTRAFVAQRHAFARVRVFVGIGLSDTLQPQQADAFSIVGCYAGARIAVWQRPGCWASRRRLFS